MASDGLMEGVYDIVHRAQPRMSIESMRAEWDRIKAEAIGPAAEASVGDWRLFVVRMHDYFRLRRVTHYVSTAWNFFAALAQQAEGCNCACSSILILLACAEVGLFGRPTAAPQGDVEEESLVCGGYVTNHIFLVIDGDSPESDEFFETTLTCRGSWVDRVTFANMLGDDAEHWCCLSVSTRAALLSVCAVAASQGLPRAEASSLLAAYPDAGNPKWNIAFVRALPANLLDGSIYLAALFDLARAAAPCARSFVLVIADIVHGAALNVRFSPHLLRDGSLADACAQIADVLDHAARMEPGNAKVVEQAARADYWAARVDEAAQAMHNTAAAVAAAT